MADFSAAANPALVMSRLGVNNFDSVAWDNFIRTYTAETIVAYKRSTVFAPLVRQKTITKGKSTTFPMLGRSTAEYFIPGNEITGGKLRAGERTVTIDDLMISAKRIYNLDEAMNYYETRSQYSFESGQALAYETDRNIARMLIKAALATNLASAADLVQSYKQFDEEEFTDNIQIGDVSGDENDPLAIAYAIQMAIKEMSKKDIDTSGLIVVLPPDQYFSLIDVRDSSKLTYMNRDFGGVGSISGTKAPPISGLNIIMSNNLDAEGLWNNSTGVTTDSSPLDAALGSGRAEAYDMPVAYLPTALKVRGMVFSKDAVCTCNLLGMQMESVYQAQYQSTLMITKKAEGHNILRPASAIALTAV
jgi:hypothetical protein